LPGSGARSPSDKVDGHTIQPVERREPRSSPAITQDEKIDAQKLYLGLEKRIRESKSLKVVVQVELDNNGMKITCTGSFIFAEGNKARFELHASDAGKVLSKSVVSDGKMVSIQANDDSSRSETAPVPSRFSADARALLARLGAFITLAWIDPRNL